MPAPEAGTGAGPVEAALMRELGAGPAGVEATTAAAAGCEGGLRVLRAGCAGASARAAAGERRPAACDFVVLLHGRGHAASMWFPLLPELAARHRVLAFDLPGFGASGCWTAAPARGASGAAERALAFFVEPIEEVLRNLGSARFSLVGHSLGGLVALELALRRRVDVSRVALVDAMGLGPRVAFAARCFFRAHPERLARALGPRAFGWLNPSPPTALGRRVAALEHELLTSASRRRARRAAARAFDHLCPLAGAAFHRRERLPELAMPTLILHGERDRALPAAQAAAAQPLMPSSRLATFADLGHAPHLEAPERVLAALLPFV